MMNIKTKKVSTDKPTSKKGLLEKYFKKINVSQKKAKIVDIRLVFLIVLKDFEAGIINPNDLSYIGTQLYFEVGKPSWYDNTDMELGKLLYEASEATWYQKKDHDKYKIMKNRLENYYERNKQLLTEK